MTLTEIKKTAFVLSCFLTIGCNENNKSKIEDNIRINNKILTERQVGSVIIKLNEQKDSIHAYLLIDTLFLYNKNNGFVYFEKGIIENFYSHYSIAIVDFQTAMKLNYSKKKCETMINASKSMMNGRIQFN